MGNRSQRLAACVGIVVAWFVANDARAFFPPFDCVIGGVGYYRDTVNPANPCQHCVAGPAWSPRTGVACNDGQFCTEADRCSAAGVCVGVARSCDDGVGCTHDVCVEASDSCRSTIASGCHIGGACVPAGAPDPANPCLACVPSVSATSYSAAVAGTACDDGSFCTTGDACDGAGHCGSTPRDCSDGLTCTTDACDEAADACTSTLASGCLIAGACIEAGARDGECHACLPETSPADFSYSPSDVCDSDGDTFYDLDEPTGDTDGDGLHDAFDADDDEDGIPTAHEAEDGDEDGAPDAYQVRLVTDVAYGASTPRRDSFGDGGVRGATIHTVTLAREFASSTMHVGSDEASCAIASQRGSAPYAAFALLGLAAWLRRSVKRNRHVQP